MPVTGQPGDGLALLLLVSTVLARAQLTTHKCQEWREWGDKEGRKEGKWRQNPGVGCSSNGVPKYVRGEEPAVNTTDVRTTWRLIASDYIV